ncbi:CDP-alcohol phosphatidyltransferase family protein [Microbacterium sp. cf332]|uniref:CDP-alcohol phosphatidyltransferase family protein n=1 Tax=Microbacterium sp. cf332 TaxID=1761804 RepID=UPI00088F8D53|nr:CDP-alcohol phosphatidyltransferase family protein [Microbacterium sp. cf332]SDQ97504.1 Phosphatidylglycerophosphate synthase [Microbacterium sp. cf332]
MRFDEAWSSLRQAQKGKRGVSLYSRWVNRPLGRVFAAAAAATGVGPNAVTGVSALATIAGLAVVAAVPASIASGIVAAALLVIGFALDAADGQVARLTGASSRAGEWLDHVVDAGKMVAVHAAVLIGFTAGGRSGGAWLLLPLAYALVAVVLFAGLTLYSLLAPASGTTPPPSTLRAVLLLPADYGILAVAFVLWGAPDLFVVVYALLLIATTGITVLLARKWFRSLAAANGAPAPAAPEAT